MNVSKNYILSFLDIFPEWDKWKIIRKYIQRWMCTNQRLEQYVQWIKKFHQFAYEQNCQKHMIAFKNQEKTISSELDNELEEWLQAI